MTHFRASTRHDPQQYALRLHYAHTCSSATLYLETMSLAPSSAMSTMPIPNNEDEARRRSAPATVAQSLRPRASRCQLLKRGALLLPSAEATVAAAQDATGAAFSTTITPFASPTSNSKKRKELDCRIHTPLATFN